MTGIVKSFSAHKGYGFIMPLIGKPDTVEHVYFHVSVCESLAPPPIGAQVHFDLVRGERGPQAANIKLVRLGKNSLRHGNLENSTGFRAGRTGHPEDGRSSTPANSATCPDARDPRANPTTQVR